jgi:hypothetical protein
MSGLANCDLSYSRYKVIPLESYAVLHRAMLVTGYEYGLSVADVRFLLALARRGGESNTAELETDLLGDAAAIRRSLGMCRPVFCEGGNKRGVRLPIRLTGVGREVADAVAERLPQMELAA